MTKNVDEFKNIINKYNEERLNKLNSDDNILIPTYNHKLKQYLIQINEITVSYIENLMNKWINYLTKYLSKIDTKIKYKILHHYKRHTELCSSVEYRLYTCHFRYDIIIDIPTQKLDIPINIACYVCMDTSSNKYEKIEDLTCETFNSNALNLIKEDIFNQELEMTYMIINKDDSEPFK